jgi:hypothetical protein
LDILGKGHGSLMGLPANSYSVAVQQQTVSALERRQFPDKTACEAEEWQWVHCEIVVDKRRKTFVDLITPDLAGESLALELDNPGSCPSIRTCVRNSAAIILLVDAERARDGGSDEDLFATKILTYLYQFGPTSGRIRKNISIPVAVTLTKADLCPEAVDDPRKFARDNLRSLTQFCDRNVQKTRYFSASAVGGVAHCVELDGAPRNLPLDVQPRGIVDPLAWAIKA